MLKIIGTLSNRFQLGSFCLMNIHLTNKAFLLAASKRSSIYSLGSKY